MGNRGKYLLKNTSIFAIGELGTKLINFFLVPFYTHVLTTEQYGTVDLIFTVSMVVIPLVMFNIGEAVMRYALDQNADYSKIFTIAAGAIVFGVLAALLSLPISAQFELFAAYKFYIYLYIVLSAAKAVVTSFLRGLEELKLYVSCNLLNVFLIGAFNIYFLLYRNMGIEGYLSAYILAEAITIAFAFVAGKFWNYCRHWCFDRKLAREMALFSLAVIPNSLLWWVINSSDRIMVTSMSSIAENGLLAVSYKLPSLLTMANTILMQAWKYSAIREESSLDHDRFADQMLDGYLRSMFLIAATMLLLIRPVTGILFAKPYYLSWKPSAYLIIGFVVMGTGTFVGTIYYVKKNMVGNMLSALCGAIVNIVLNFFLIHKMGASGATLAACIAYIAILLYRYWDTRQIQTLHIFRWQYIVSFVLLFVLLFANHVTGMFGVVGMIAVYAAILGLNGKVIVQVTKKFVRMLK